MNRKIRAYIPISSNNLEVYIMKRLITLLFIVLVSVFSFSGIALSFNLDPFEQITTHYDWLIIALGVVCFIKLRKLD